MLAYSRNIIDSLTRQVSVNLTVDNRTLGLMTEHYKIFEKQTLSNICEEGIQCVLRVVAEGNVQGDVYLWMTAALSESSIPLFEGVVLPFNKQNIQAEYPIRFYYQLSDEKATTILIKSDTYS